MLIDFRMIMLQFAKSNFAKRAMGPKRVGEKGGSLVSDEQTADAVIGHRKLVRIYLGEPSIKGESGKARPASSGCQDGAAQEGAPAPRITQNDSQPEES